MLDGRGRRNDAIALRVAFNGGTVFYRSGRMKATLISAPTIADLPPGLYSLIDTNPYHTP